MLAEIASGHVDLADVMFLIGALLFVLAAFVPMRLRQAVGEPGYGSILGWLGLAAVAIGLLVL